MTDRLSGLLVIFEKDIRGDDAQSTIDAIGHIKGVLDVVPNVSDPSGQIAEIRAKNEIRNKLIEIITP